MNKIHALMLLGCSALALSGCGPADIASPGTGGNVTINNPAAPTPTPTATATGGTQVVAAASCPVISGQQAFIDNSTVTGPTGSYRLCALPELVSSNMVLPKVTGTIYELRSRVNVGCDGGPSVPTTASPYVSTTAGCGTVTSDSNVTLTIDPGAIVIGSSGQSWLAVNRGNKISAVGTQTSPIIFTSRQNVVGTNGDDTTAQGQWGGVVLLGRGRVTDCDLGTVAAGTCQRRTEGAAEDALFGGSDNTYNAGRMSFVQIRYSGAVLGANRELQSLTPEAIGTGTVLDHIMSFNSSDDGIEPFGGAMNMKYFIAVGADDDSMDGDTGVQANYQYVLLLPRPGKGDALFEIDSNGAETDTPRTKLQIANFTAIQPVTSSDNEGNDQAAALFRGNSDTTLINGIILAPSNECIRMNASGTTPATLTARSTLMQCNAAKYLGTGAYTATQVSSFFASGSTNNNDAFVPASSNGFIIGTGTATATNPKTVVPTADQGFFDATTYVGAVRDSSDTWYSGWTCNSDVANFGSNTGLCSSLPTT